MNMVSVINADDCQSNGSIDTLSNTQYRPSTAHMFDSNSLIAPMFYNSTRTQPPVVDHMRIAINDQCVPLPTTPTTANNLNNKHLLPNTTFDPSFLNPMKKRVKHAICLYFK